MDVGLGEYVQRNNTAPWLAAYRLLSQSSPCVKGGISSADIGSDVGQVATGMNIDLRLMHSGSRYSYGAIL